MNEKFNDLKIKASMMLGVVGSRIFAWWESEATAAKRDSVHEFVQRNRIIIGGVFLALVFVLVASVHAAEHRIVDLKHQLNEQHKSLRQLETVVEDLQTKLADYRVPSNRPHNMAAYKETFRETEQRYGIPENMLYHIARVESNFNATVVSEAGAVGLMQIVPKWHPDVDPMDPHASIRYAGKYLRAMYDQFGTWGEALAAYNWGPANLGAYGLSNAPDVTHNYLIEVMVGTFGGSS